MRIIFEIPIDVYHLCLTRFGLRSREYAILQNGVIMRDDAGNEFVHVLCDEEAAQLIRAKLNEACPDLLHRIRERPANSAN
jgi:hypothetical protein